MKQSSSTGTPLEAPGSNWPYVAPDPPALPATLPGGQPWPRISVITPTRNQGRFLEQTILSVLNQGYPNVEHIIIDGASTDETPEILDRYRDRLARVVSEPDRGQSHAINKGMARATGEILTWLNSDDMLAPGALAAVALAFATCEADMIAGVCELYSEGRLVGRHVTSCEDGPLPLEELLDLEGSWLAGQFFYQPEVMFRRSLWERAGGYVDESLHYVMDSELWVRFAEAGAVLHVIGHPVARFRVHAAQKTNDSEPVHQEYRRWREGYLERRGNRVRSKPVFSAPRTRLRILFLNDQGFRFGAGIAHRRLARALAWGGHEVQAVSLCESPVSPGQDPPYTTRQVIETVGGYEPDLVIVGNLHAARPPLDLLQELDRHWTTMWCLHDLWLLTGRCAQPRECTKYKSGCDESCPTPEEYPQLDPAKIHQAWRAKHEFLCSCSPVLLANSEWTAKFARAALWANEGGKPCGTVETFRLSVPLDELRPLDQATCRALLGIAGDAFVVLAPWNFADPWKNPNHLLQALRMLCLPGLLLVTTSPSPPDEKEAGSIRIQRVGYDEDPKRMAMLYSAADVVVGCGTAESFGQIFIEAAACGTPSVGYPAAGAQEAVRDGVTGLLTENVGPAYLAATIRVLYDDPERRKTLGRWGALYIRNEWTPFNAYRAFRLLLRRLGLEDRLQLARQVVMQSQPGRVAPATPISRMPLSSVPRAARPRLFIAFSLARAAFLRLVKARGRRVREARQLAGEFFQLLAVMSWGEPLIPDFIRLLVGVLALTWVFSPKFLAGFGR